MSVVAAVVVPVFGVVAVGYGLAKSGLFGPAVGEALVRFMYYLAIPAMLFSSLANADLPGQVPWRFLLAFYLPSMMLFGVGMHLARRVLGWERRAEGMAGMTGSYSNMVLLGFPLSLAAFGEAGAVPMFILLASQSVLMFPLTTYTIEVHGNADRRAADVARSALGLAFNPVILSLVLGVVANVYAIPVSIAVARLLELLSGAGPGCALVALGVSLAQYRLGGSYREVAWLVLLKNLVHPAVVWAACAAAAIPVAWTQVAVLLAAMPTGINAFIFSGRYGVRQETVSKTIVISTALSCVVVTALLGVFIG